MIQNNNTLMSDKIQSTLVNTIPLWKNQMVLALGLEHSRQAASAQREVADMTQRTAEKNADALKMATVDIARESERGVVDIETLQHTNQSLISTLDERPSDSGGGTAETSGGRAGAFPSGGRAQTEAAGYSRIKTRYFSVFVIYYRRKQRP